MTSEGQPQQPNLTELPVAQLLAEITHDHAVATRAGKLQGETLVAMGRKAAEVYQRGGISWRRLAAETAVSVRTLRRYAQPYLK